MSPLPMKGCKIKAYARRSGHFAGRGLYHAIPAVTRDLRFSGLIRRTAPFSRLLQHTRGCGGSILTQILTGSEYKILNSMYLYWLKYQYNGYFLFRIYKPIALSIDSKQYANINNLHVSHTCKFVFKSSKSPIVLIAFGNHDCIP
jgi:hypothetical protein